MSLCDVSHPPPLIREFYSNLSIHFDDSSGHYLTTWIRSEEFQITKKVVFDALNVPLVRRLTYPYIESPPIEDVMSLLCGRSVIWGSEPRINSSEFTELNYLFFRIACHDREIQRCLKKRHAYTDMLRNPIMARGFRCLTHS